MEFKAVICLKLENFLTLPSALKFPTVKDEFELDLYKDDEFIPMAIPAAEIIDTTGRPGIMQSLADGLINAEALLPIGDSHAMATVISCAVDNDGPLIGGHDNNPMLKSLIYMCEFPD